MNKGYYLKKDGVSGEVLYLEYDKIEGYNITPKTIKKSIQNNLLSLVQSYRSIEDVVAEQMVELNVKTKDLPKLLEQLEADMHKAAKLLDFERAIQLRDEIKKIKSLVQFSQSVLSSSL